MMLLNKYQILSESLDASLYHIYGAILGCLKDSPQIAIKKYNLKIHENLPDDPWIAIVETKKPVTQDILWQFWKDHTKDPDNSNVPYYFIAREINTKLEYVLYTDEHKMYAINTQKEKLIAKAAGAKKGLKTEHLDF